MIDKNYITEKLQNFFKKNEPKSVFKIFIISFLFDKMNYIEKKIGYENSLELLIQYIYNLENNLNMIREIDDYHSIFAKYDFESKCLKYYMTNDYKKINIDMLTKDKKKEVIIKEFKIMIYKELEKIININQKDSKIISNGFYVEDANGRYPDYNGDFSDIIDIFSEVEICNYINLKDKFKIYIDVDKKYYIYSNHISQRNSEVLNYVQLWKKFLNKNIYYLGILDPKNYTEKVINDFNLRYKYVLRDSKYEFLLKNKDVFSLIENYLLHIKNRINIENNVQYHQDLSVIFKLMNKKNQIKNISRYMLHASSISDKLNFEEI